MSGKSNQIGQVNLYTDETNRMHIFKKRNGFSGDTVVNAMKPVMELKEKKQQDKIDFVDNELTAITDINKILVHCRDAAAMLASPSVPSNKIDFDILGVTIEDVLSKKVPSFFSTNASINPTSVVAVKIEDDAPNGDFSVEVERIAKKDAITSTVNLSSQSTILVAKKTNLWIGDVQITIPEQSSLFDISQKINQYKAQTNISASVRKYGSQGFRLFLSHSDVGHKINLKSIIDRLTQEFPSEKSALGLDATIIIDSQIKEIDPELSLTDISDLLKTDNYDTRISFSGTGYSLEVSYQGGAWSAISTSIAQDKLCSDIGLSANSSTEEDLMAKYYIDNSTVAFFSQSNTVTDIYEKSSITFLAPTGGAVITTTVSNDFSKIYEAIISFVEKYNEMVTTFENLTARDPENGYEPKEGAFLAKNSFFKNIMDNVIASVRNQPLGFSDTLDTFGLNLKTDLKIEINEQKLTDALNNNLQNLISFFGFRENSLNDGFFTISARPYSISNDILRGKTLISISKNDAGIITATLSLQDILGNITASSSFSSDSTYVKENSSGVISIRPALGSKFENFSFLYEGPIIPTPAVGDSYTVSDEFKIRLGIAVQFYQKLRETIISKRIAGQKIEDQTNEFNRLLFIVNEHKKKEINILDNLKDKNIKELVQAQKKAEHFEINMEKLEAQSQQLSTFLHQSKD
jgi:flagellar capping protein FliD